MLNQAGKVRLVIQGLSRKCAIHDDKHLLLSLWLRPAAELVEISRDGGQDVFEPRLASAAQPPRRTAWVCAAAAGWEDAAASWTPPSRR